MCLDILNMASSHFIKTAYIFIALDGTLEWAPTLHVTYSMRRP